MIDAQLVERAKSLIDDLAQTPRFAGSAEEARARRRCRTELETAGFVCSEIPFSYSEWPGRWGPPLLALFFTGYLVSFLEFGVRGSLSGSRWIWFVALWVAPWAYRFFTRGILTFGFSRASSTNLEARRGDATVWLVAHVDSKSQTIPMLLRVAGSAALPVAAVLAVIGVALALMQLPIDFYFFRTAEIIALVGAVPTVFCFIRNTSRGALDNATGVAAVLLAAGAPAAPHSLGVLITSAEELGLAGARTWANSIAAKLVVLNCDTVDDAGEWRCMYSGNEPTRLTLAAEAVCFKLGTHIRIGRLIPGIMADNMAFSERFHSAITLSRGTLGTLARIHTARDNSARLTGEGAAEASVLLSAMAKELS
ncbi:MAG TPA: M28 family peptidase [Gemmatimonadaceae bacterium]